MQEHDPLVTALEALIEREGGRIAVADAIEANEQSLYQILKRIPNKKTGRPKGVGPQLRAKLTKRYPDWMSLGKIEANNQNTDTAAAAEPSLQEAIRCLAESLMLADAATRDTVKAILARLVDAPQHYPTQLTALTALLHPKALSMPISTGEALKNPHSADS